MTDTEHEALMAEIMDATSDHDLACDYDTCEIRRARDDGFHLHAAQYLVDATGNGKVHHMLSKFDPDGTLRAAEWDAFVIKEHEREEKAEQALDERPAPSEQVKTIQLGFRVPVNFDTPSETLQRARDLLLVALRHDLEIRGSGYTDEEWKIVNAFLTES